jgi:hypothetical protein
MVSDLLKIKLRQMSQKAHRRVATADIPSTVTYGQVVGYRGIEEALCARATNIDFGYAIALAGVAVFEPSTYLQWLDADGLRMWMDWLICGGD